MTRAIKSATPITIIKQPLLNSSMSDITCSFVIMSILKGIGITMVDFFNLYFQNEPCMLCGMKNSTENVLLNLTNAPSLDSVQAKLCKKDYEYFVKRFWNVVSPDDLKWNWHMTVIKNEMTKIAKRVAARKKSKYDLVINIPPGMTKSLLASIMFPAWCWLNWPWMRFLCVSYAADLALDQAELNRDILQSDDFAKLFPHLGIKKSKEAKGNFELVDRTPGRKRKPGKRFSTSVRGTITGMHGDIILIDDPFDPRRSASMADRIATNEWLTQTLPTRTGDKDATTMILIMQRLHEEDTTGHWLKNRGKEIKHICLPGIVKDFGKIKGYKQFVKPKKYLKYYKKGSIDPRQGRMSKTVVKKLYNQLNEDGFACQIGQSPVPPGGSTFEIDKIVKVKTWPQFSPNDKFVRYWDKAGSERQLNKRKRQPSFTCGTLMAFHSVLKKWFILDVVRDQWKAPMREVMIKKTAQIDGVRVRIAIEQEPGSGGKESAESSVINLAGFSVKLDHPTGDKELRAEPYSTQFNNGNIIIVEGAWNKAWLHEHLMFPYSSHKDQVDSAGGAFQQLTESKVARVIY